MPKARMRLPVIMIAILIFLICCALVITLIQHRPSPQREQQKDAFTPDQELVIPDGPVIEKKQYPSRVTPEKWSDTDLNRWFTKPEGRAMQNLKDSNDAIVSTITGAAP